jgi:hypothetical protein
MSYGCGATTAPTRAPQLPQEGPWRRSERECKPLTLYATGDRTTTATTCQDSADGGAEHAQVYSGVQRIARTRGSRGRRTHPASQTSQDRH